jgi:hypothetical protein
MFNQRFSAVILLTVMTMAVTSVVLTSGILFGSKTINHEGNVNSVGVGVFWNQECTSEVTSVDWGYLEPSSSQNHTIYIKNEGTTPMVLNMTTDGWSPTDAPTYIALDWNQEGTEVTAYTVVETVLTLSVSSEITEISTFNFNMTITGTEI